MSPIGGEDVIVGKLGFKAVKTALDGTSNIALNRRAGNLI